MAGYDPKRPRPVADGDEPAPVDALLDTGSVEAVQVGEPAPVESSPAESSAAEPAPVEPAPVEPAPTSDPAPVAPDPADSAPTSDPAPVAPDPADSAAAQPSDRHLRSVPASDSTVPVADRPAEPTANRAVVFVGAGAAALVALLLLLALRRRRR